MNLTTSLEPTFDSRKSFYGKARIIQTENSAELWSYNTHVVTINLTDYTVELQGAWDYSATTVRHVKEFLKQFGLSAGSKAEIAKLYS